MISLALRAYLAPRSICPCRSSLTNNLRVIAVYLVATFESTGPRSLVVQCDHPLARKFNERVLARVDAASAEKNQAREILAVVLFEICSWDVDGATDVRPCFRAGHRDPPIHCTRSSFSSYPLCISVPCTAHGRRSACFPRTPAVCDRSPSNAARMKIHFYQKRIRGGRRRSPVQHRPRLSWHGRNLDGSRVRSMASIPLLSMSLSSIISPSLTRRLSLVASIQPPRTRPIPSSPAPSKSSCETWKHSRVQTLTSVRLSQEKPGEALIDLRMFHHLPHRRHNDHGRLTVSCAPLARCATLPDAHRACKAPLVVQCLPRCAIPPRRRARYRRCQHLGWYLRG